MLIVIFYDTYAVYHASLGERREGRKGRNGSLAQPLTFVKNMVHPLVDRAGPTSFFRSLAGLCAKRLTCDSDVGDTQNAIK